jgi:hypothetical protein
MLSSKAHVALRRTRARRPDRAPDTATIKALVSAVRRQRAAPVALDRAARDRLAVTALKQIRMR